MSMRSSAGTLVAVLLLCGSAAAHDTGFGHSRRALYVTTAPDGFALEYRVKQNPEEALVQMTLIDANGDGEISGEEKDRYFTKEASTIAERLKCTSAKGASVHVEPVNYQLDQALTQLFRFRIATDETVLLLTDEVFPQKPGVVRVVTGAGVKAEIDGKVDLTHAERVTIRLSRTRPAGS